MSLIEYFEVLREQARERMDSHRANANWTGFNYQLGSFIAFGIAVRKLEMQKAWDEAEKAGAE